jgi:ATP-dependent helicase HrpA
MVKEKITALIKLLPKALRTNFIPAPEFADRTLEVLFPPPGEESPSIGVEAGETPFLEALALALEHLRDVPVPSDAWQDAILPEHLRMHFAVVDRAGKRLASGRDLDLIRRQLRAQLGAALARVPDARYNRESVAEWDFGDLPERIEVKHEGLTITAHPALAAPASPSLPGKHDPGALRKASIRLFESLDAANASMPRGLRILFLNQVRHELAFLLKNLPGLDRLSMQYATLGTAAEFKEDLSYLIVDRAFELSESSAPIRTEAQFRARLDPGWSRLSEVAHDAAALAASVLAEYQPVSARLAGPIPQAWSEAVGDIASQLSRLVHRFFLSSTPYVALQHYPRYLRAIMSRLNKLQNAGPARDQKHSSRVAPLWGAYIELESSHRTAGIQDPELDRLRWMIEELRVSLFAQELGTPQTVSVKRVEEQLARVRSR